MIPYMSESNGISEAFEGRGIISLKMALFGKNEVFF